MEKEGEEGEKRGGTTDGGEEGMEREGEEREKWGGRTKVKTGIRHVVEKDRRTKSNQYRENGNQYRTEEIKEGRKEGGKENERVGEGGRHAERERESVCVCVSE